MEKTESTGHDSSGGLRGYKGHIHEGGHRVPFIARWGDGTSGGSLIEPGSRSQQTICIQDWVATMYELTGQPMKKGHALDSVSLLPVFAGKQPANRPLRDVSVYQQGGSANQLAIRRRDWKMILDEKERPSELYNLAEDLKEEDNRINDPDQQQRIDELKKLYNRIRYQSDRSTPVVDYTNSNIENS